VDVYLFESVILLHLLQRLRILCLYSVVFDTTAIFYNGKVFSTVNREVLFGNGGLYVHVVLFDTFVNV
jgi:hypothetical protein